MSDGFNVVETHKRKYLSLQLLLFSCFPKMDAPQVQVLRYCLRQSVSDSGLFYNHIAPRLVPKLCTTVCLCVCAPLVDISDGS